MIKRVVGFLSVGLVLAACGTISPAKAMQSWVAQSNFETNVKVVISDARHSARALSNPATDANDLHTVCAVLNLDDTKLNASLPTPDDQASALLARAYGDIGAGANECYELRASQSGRARSLANLRKGVALLSEGTARVASQAQS
ncbi:MAG: hypothetical protein ABI298_02905 [Acidimicrobiales bacterium]